MIYRVILTDPVQNQVRHLAPAIKYRVKSALRVLAVDPHLGKPLERNLAGLWRFRAQRYRIVYRIQRERRHVEVVVIAHRRDVYGIAADALRVMERRGTYTRRSRKAYLAGKVGNL